jgi:hypothetical protein
MTLKKKKRALFTRRCELSLCFFLAGLGDVGGSSASTPTGDALFCGGGEGNMDIFNAAGDNDVDIDDADDNADADDNDKDMEEAVASDLVPLRPLLHRRRLLFDLGMSVRPL